MPLVFFHPSHTAQARRGGLTTGEGRDLVGGNRGVALNVLHREVLSPAVRHVDAHQVVHVAATHVVDNIVHQLKLYFGRIDAHFDEEILHRRNRILHVENRTALG